MGGESKTMAGVKSPYVEFGMSYATISGESKLSEEKRQALSEYNRLYKQKRKEKKRVMEMLKTGKAPYFNIGSGGKG